MERSVLHMDLDTFFVSVERLLDTRLNGRPILIGGSGDRGVVAACSYEARAFGIHSAMPMRMARELCPEAVVIHGNSATYSAHSQAVTEIVRESVPVVEKASVDEFYADLTGVDRFLGTYKMATELRERIVRETGLPLSFGLSVNKTVSKVATGVAKPNNQLRIASGQEKIFLAPLSVRKIPMVGEKMYQSLRNLGVQRVGTVQEMPVELLQQVFGKPGKTLWEKAQGVDPSPVVPTQERKTISAERTFERDTLDTQKLEGLLTAMVENLCFQLRRGEKVTSEVTIKIRYADFETQTKQRKIPYTSADHLLIPLAKSLFQELHSRRLMVRLLGIRFGGLVGGGLQFQLFEEEDRAYQLYHALDAVRKKYGDRAVVRASGLHAK
jgi:DNA polymerase-4